MKLVVLGASGGVGRHVVTEALAAGHEVTAAVRTATSYDAPPGVRVVRGALPELLATDLLAGADAVLSSLGIKRKRPANPWSALASPPDFCSSSARDIVAAMKRHGVNRVVAVSAAGVAESAAHMNAVMRFLVARSNVGIAYRDLAVMEQVYADSGLDWLCVRPTALDDKPKSDKLDVVRGFKLTDAISRVDVACWMVARLNDAHWLNRTPQITRGTRS